MTSVYCLGLPQIVPQEAAWERRGSPRSQQHFLEQQALTILRVFSSPGLQMHWTAQHREQAADSRGWVI